MMLLPIKRQMMNDEMSDYAKALAFFGAAGIDYSEGVGTKLNETNMSIEIKVDSAFVLFEFDKNGKYVTVGAWH